LLAVLAILAIGALGFGIGRWTDSSSSSSSNASATSPTVPSNNNGNGNSGNSGNNGSNGSNGNGSANNGNGNRLPFGGNLANRGFLGVATVADNGNGAQITQVQSGSPADTAGLKVGDVVTGVDGNQVTSPAELALRIVAHPSGDKVTIHYTRNGQAATVDVTLGSRPGAAQSSPS
jgi:putative serine protease PepD